jgi:hypothetical protein
MELVVIDPIHCVAFSRFSLSIISSAEIQVPFLHIFQTIFKIFAAKLYAPGLPQLGENMDTCE